MVNTYDEGREIELISDRQQFGLSWRVLNSTPKKRNDIFYKGSKAVSESRFETLKTALKNMEKRWRGEIDKRFGSEKKTHFEISGGNLTFCFILPEAVRFIQKGFPEMPFHLRLIEGKTGVGIGCGAQLTLSGVYVNADIDKEMKSAISDLSGTGKYKMFRRFCKDEYFLCSSARFVEKHGVEYTRQHQDLLFGRLYPSQEGSYGDEYYSFRPKGRTDEPAIVSDQYFMNYLFMVHEGGIWLTSVSSGGDERVKTIEDKSIFAMARFFVADARIEKKFNLFVRKSMSLLKGRRI